MPEKYRLLRQKLLDLTPNWDKCEGDDCIRFENRLRGDNSNPIPEGYAKDVQRLIDAGNVIHAKVHVVQNVLYRECHAVSAYLYRTVPNLTLFAGFAYSSDECSGGGAWHYHSFLMSVEGVIYEPTPIARDIYFGVALYGEDAKQVVASKEYSIFNAGLYHNVEIQKVIQQLRGET